MSNAPKIGRNAVCPCGSGTKYKDCCFRKGIPWPEIRQKGLSATIPYLSARGKNLYFYSALFEALQIDPHKGDFTLEQVKRGFSAENVMQLYDAVGCLWPNFSDLNRVLVDERKRISGLYVGNYERNTIIEGVKRHSLYSDSILLVDPFMHPLRFRDDLNPLLHPEKHRSNALKAALIWLEMYPWVRRGIVRFVRTPIDYDRELLLQTIQAGEQRHSQNPELKRLLDAQVEKEIDEDMDEYKEFYSLHISDEVLYKGFVKSSTDAAEVSFADFCRYRNQKRAAHPYYLDSQTNGKKEAYIGFSSGANYDLAKHTAAISGSYLLTDIPSRWREIELDRESAGIDEQNWSPFAKALSKAPLNCLKDVPLKAAFELRQRGRLEEMRLFLRKVWKASASNQQFDSANAANLAAELGDRIREAQGEYDKIKLDLTGWLAATGAASLASAWMAPATVGMVATATGTISGLATLAKARQNRAVVESKYPACFFMKLQQK